METSVQSEQEDLFQQLESACWQNKMYTIGIDTPAILPSDVQAICDAIKAAGLPVPIEQLLDLSEFRDRKDSYPQRYVLGYFELMNMAIDFIQEFYNQLDIVDSRGG